MEKALKQQKTKEANLWSQKTSKAGDFVHQKIGESIYFSVFESGTWTHISLGKTGNQVKRSGMYFDIASLTKIFTALQVLEFASAKKLQLSDTLGTYIPFLKDTSLNIQDVLCHRQKIKLINKYCKSKIYLASDLSGLFENQNNIFFESQKEGYEYGDLGYLYLGMLIEKISEQKLSGCFAEFCRKYELSEILYNPLSKGVHMNMIAPSKKGLMPGVVNDEKSRWYGGACGHAGLFATQDGLQNFVTQLYKKVFDINEEYYKLLFKPAYEQSSISFSIGGWRLGKYSDYPNMTGYTGPGIFLSPQEKKALVYTCVIQDRQLYKSWCGSLID